MKILQEGIAQPSSRPCPRRVLAVVTEVTGRDLGKTAGTPVERAHHLWRGSLLRSEDVGSPILSTERIGDVGGNGETHPVESLDIIPHTVTGQTVDDGPEHADAAVAGGTAAQSDDDLLAPTTHRIHHELPCAVTGGHQGVALFCRQQRESAGLRDLYHGRVTLDQIGGSDGTHQWVAHRQPDRLAAPSAAKRLQPSLSPIADGHLNHLCLGILGEKTLCRCPIGLAR